MEKSGTFLQWGDKALHCVYAVFVLVFKCHALKRHRAIEKKIPCTWFHKLCDLTVQMVSMDYSEPNITSQNVRKKILHVLHFKRIISMKYFSSYIKKCQAGTYFFLGGGGGLSVCMYVCMYVYIYIYIYIYIPCVCVCVCVL